MVCVRDKCIKAPNVLLPAAQHDYHQGKITPELWDKVYNTTVRAHLAL